MNCLFLFLFLFFACVFLLAQMVTKVSEDNLQRGDPSCLDGVEDMVKMDILTVGSVLHNLRLALYLAYIVVVGDGCEPLGQRLCWDQRLLTVVLTSTSRFL